MRHAPSGSSGSDMRPEVGKLSQPPRFREAKGLTYREEQAHRRGEKEELNRSEVPIRKSEPLVELGQGGPRQDGEKEGACQEM